ncbi:hypothetical protein A9C19_16710 [Bacillus weihaiensis]|uniref:Uncharacterized protein n=2 Tax=Bacillus weihaiensis TaxID=1547283 RepID=A0A1L3MV79_9BACI|nr:hypothetical protein A9C19_16710 [Bacillus weihaiensis]
MHPIEFIEWIVASVILLVILAVSFYLKGKWKKIIQGLAVVYILSLSVFYLVRPYWIDFQLENKVGYLQTHLEQQYPEETWTFWTVPHREDGYESMNPYIIGVTFDKEPEVEYAYLVRNEKDIYQMGYSTENQYEENLLHLEDE